MHSACGARARHGLGERCIGDAECSTGLCCEGACSTCCASAGAPQRGCDDGELCETASDTAAVPARICSPGEGRAAAGEPCLAHADCTSGACNGPGALRLCQNDGRVCADDADCPADFACVEAGIAGGTCQ
jgi:hypothetical protein